jgi:aspartate racemase
VKTLGMIGGVGPESTIDYYKLIIAEYRERKRDSSYPPIIINSIDMNRARDLVTANALAELTEYLVAEVQRLARAGADFGLIAANTPHIVFDDIRRQSPIPLISIVEATCDAAKALGLRRLGLLGTRFTMRGRFFPDVFTTAGITLVVPSLDDQDYIHEKYMGELVNGIFLPETRTRLLEIVGRLQEQERIDGAILGGTELPLLLREAPPQGIPFLDTTQIHVGAAVEEML